MTHRIDPDPRYIAAGLARLEAMANATPGPHNCPCDTRPVTGPLADLEGELVAAAARRHAAQTSARARRRIIAWAACSAVLGSLAIVAIVVGAYTAAGLS